MTVMKEITFYLYPNKEKHDCNKRFLMFCFTPNKIDMFSMKNTVEFQVEKHVPSIR